MQLAIREPASAITHLIGMLAAMIAGIPLLAKAGGEADGRCLASMAVYVASMILLYGASATYHSVVVDEKKLRRFQKLDHMMIFVLIAGTYTPICTLVLDRRSGRAMLALVWGLALVGMLINICWISCPKWFSSIIYIAMGWVCVLVFGKLWRALPTGAFALLLAGGIIYTVGGIIYALKLPIFNSKHKNFGSHEVFHLFVMAGSLCHFIMMYVYLA